MEERRLARLNARVEQRERELEEARREWAAFVRQVGINVVAERMGMSKQAISHRVRAIEGRAKRTKRP